MQKQNLQDLFLNEARRKNVPLTVFLVNGFQMRGTVRSFDSFTVALMSEGREQLIYKHAISTVSPAKRLELPLAADGAAETDIGC
ncbi:MAG: RNA chaperone Hfq [Oscillospiraceae bacterium]|nr:RNA chaperone Hfq [Oscillospiraceae bacterium]